MFTLPWWLVGRTLDPGPSCASDAGAVRSTIFAGENDQTMGNFPSPKFINQNQSTSNWLVAWNIIFYDFPYVGNVIIPTDFHIFRRGWNHQPVLYIYTLCIDIFWLNQDTGETIKTMGNWWLIVLYTYLLIFCCVKCLRTTSFAVDSVAFPSRSWRSCHVENSWAAKIVGPPKWRKIKLIYPLVI